MQPALSDERAPAWVHKWARRLKRCEKALWQMWQTCLPWFCWLPFLVPGETICFAVGGPTDVELGMAEAGAATVVEAKGSTAECKAVLRLGEA